MRAAVIFNPSAKGDKARQFRGCLDSISQRCTLKRTSGPGDASRLAIESVAEGFDTIIAAGGDGTLNEVLNGLASAPDGLRRARLGVLPLGTVNVFARELGIPTEPGAAWKRLLDAQEALVDLPYVDFSANGKTERRFFVQLAGAGLDARAIQLTSWSLKKKIGPGAYVVAGLRAMIGPPVNLRVQADGREVTGQLVLIGNGKLYGGSFQLFPLAELSDGLLDVCVFPRAGFSQLVGCGISLLLRRRVPESSVVRLAVKSFCLSSPQPAAFELDGELVGELPAQFGVLPRALRVLAPKP